MVRTSYKAEHVSSLFYATLFSFRISRLESTLATLLPVLSTLKTTARSRADDHERLLADLTKTKEHLDGQKTLFENFALLAKRDETDGNKDKGSSFVKC